MLHDGSAAGGTFESRVTAAILAHGPLGEGAASAAAFQALSSVDRAKVVAFLDSLGRLEFDFDGDGMVDIFDLETMADCRAASGVSPDNSCAIGDIDQDGDVDTADFVGFVEAYIRDGHEAPGDCDGDGINDLLEIFNGASDKNRDGIPDTCPNCIADLDGNGEVDSGDLGTLLSAWGSPLFDLDGSGETDSGDLGFVLSGWGPCP
jgi:hypothetical protein